MSALALPDAKPWTPDQIAFQAWLALPHAARVPRQQRQLAALLEVHEVTLSDWKKLPGFHDAVLALARSRVVGELVPVLYAQVREAKRGSLPHAQWLFELAGVWTPRQLHQHGGIGGGPLRIVIETVDDRSSPDAD